MKWRFFCGRVVGLGLLLWSVSLPEAFGQWAAQTLNLTNGQNAVFMTVAPSESLDVLFSNTPVTRVQYFNPMIFRQFEVSPDNPLPRNPEWLYWNRDDLTDAANTMDRLYAGGGYIIESDAPVTLSITGSVASLQQTWNAGEFALTGFEVSGNEVTFNTFLADCKNAIASIESLRPGQSNVWDAVNWDETIKTNVSYFIKPSKPLDHAGLLKISGSLSFSRPDDVAQLILKAGSTLSNVSLYVDASLTAPDGQTPIAGSVPLRVWDGVRYLPIDAVGYHPTLQRGADNPLIFAIDHARLATRTDTNAIYAGVLRIQNDATGLLMQRPIVYNPSGAAAQSAWPSGLWIGQAAMSQVSYIHEKSTANETTAQQFPVRLIVHYGTNGQIRLLSRVVGVPATNTQGLSRYTLYTDERKVPQTNGDGVFRVSSPAFGLMPPLLMNGSFLSGSCSGTNVLAANNPLNPYRHAYNPDLTNGIAITNVYKLVWHTNDASAISVSPWNPNGTCRGTLTHTVKGLRNETITAEGEFTLERVSSTGSLVMP